MGEMVAFNGIKKTKQMGHCSKIQRFVWNRSIIILFLNLEVCLEVDVNRLDID
jgi:hypothetical protein